MRRGFITHELLFVVACSAFLLIVCLPLSAGIGWGVPGAFAFAALGYILMLCLLNARNIIDHFRDQSSRDTTPRDDSGNHDDDHDEEPA